MVASCVEKVFVLDWSGAVATVEGLVAFLDLSVFVREYLLASAEVWPTGYGYKDLAPGALLQAVRDCEAFEAAQPDRSGADFWRLRNAGYEVGAPFQPVSVWAAGGLVQMTEWTFDPGEHEPDPHEV